MKKENEEVWAYDEPHESGGNCKVTMTKEQAIQWVKNTYPTVRYNDEEAFTKFISVHWAYRYEKNK